MEVAFQRRTASRSTVLFPWGWTMEGRGKRSPSRDAGKGSVGCSFRRDSHFPVAVVVI